MKPIKPENYSGYEPRKWGKIVFTIKKRNYVLINDFSLGGDAPKEFIKVYKFGTGKRKDKESWTKYISKTGHKWYPNESITEHLLNCIGKELGLFMSNSELAIIGGQLRFLSEYFLDNERQELVHGVDIFAGYVSDRDLVEQIEQKKLSRDFFSFQFAIKAIEFAFPEDFNELVNDFVRLLIFDAIVGNNDRHFYNWGVIKDITNIKKPYFSPIFDTARGLFWNEREDKISERIKQKNQVSIFLNKYIRDSKPKTGWDGDNNLNHIELIKKLVSSDPNFQRLLEDIVSLENEKKVLSMIKKNFAVLLSVNRLELVLECLKLRFQQLRNIK